MVAKTIVLPNIRNMFIPDGGFTLFDADLDGADAQVVAWEAEDEKLKAAFRSGMKVHCSNARDVWPEICNDLSDDEIKGLSSGRLYKEIKIGVHGTNYGGKAPGLASILNWEVREAERFQRKWFRAHPEIQEWHKRTERFLVGEQCWNCRHFPELVGRPCPECGAALGNTIKNAFGFTRTYFERSMNQLQEALAWSPQSTVAIVTELGWLNLFLTPEEIEITQTDFFPDVERKLKLRELFVKPDTSLWTRDLVQALLQVHDSFIGQVPMNKAKLIPDIVEGMQVKVPYDDPLIIPWDYATSNQSWGHCG
jgi:hypothetical protein